MKFGHTSFRILLGLHVYGFFQRLLVVLTIYIMNPHMLFNLLLEWTSNVVPHVEKVYKNFQFYRFGPSIYLLFLGKHKNAPKVFYITSATNQIL